MLTCIELEKELGYKLQIMGAPIDGTEIVLGENMSIVNGDSILESKRSKKHLWICYRAVKETYEDRIWRVRFVKETYNIDKNITNILYSTAKDE